MADIAVPFMDETDAEAPSVDTFGSDVSLPPAPTELLEPAAPTPVAGAPEMSEPDRQRAIRRARLKLQAATDEVEQMKPSLEKTFTAFKYNLREGAVGGTKQALGNVTRAIADIVAPKEDHPVGSPKWFIQNALRYSIGTHPLDLINRFQDRNDPESIANVVRQGGTDLAKEGTDVLNTAQEESDRLGGGDSAAVAGFLGRTAGVSAPALLAAPLGLPIASVAAGVQNFGNTIDDFKEKFMSLDPKLTEEQAFDKALLPAGIVGTVTGLLTRGFGGLEELISKVAERGLTQQGVKAAVSETLRSAALEMPEEFLDQLSQGIIEKTFVDPDKSWHDILGDAAIAGLTALPTSLGTGGAIQAVAHGAAKTVQTAANLQERSRLRRVVADAERFRERLRLQTQETDAQSENAKTSGLPPEQGKPAVTPAAVQTETGTAQRSGPSEAVPGSPPIASTTAIVESATPQSASVPPVLKQAVFGGYMFNDPTQASYKIPGVNGQWRDVSAATAKQLGYVVPENIPTLKEWESAGRPVPPPPGTTQQHLSAAAKPLNAALAAQIGYELVQPTEARDQDPSYIRLSNSEKIAKKFGVTTDQVDKVRDMILQRASKLDPLGTSLHAKQWQLEAVRDIQDGWRDQDLKSQSRTIEIPNKLPGMTVQQIAKSFLTSPEIQATVAEYPGGQTRFMHDLGYMAKTPEDVAALRKMAEDTSTAVRKAMADGDFDRAMGMAGLQPSEAYEFATGVKMDGTPKWETFEKLQPGYAPTVPDEKFNAAKGKAQQAAPFNWQEFTKTDEAGYTVLDENKLIAAIKAGQIAGNPALNAVLLHVLENSELHPRYGIRLYDMTPDQVGTLFGTSAFHGRFYTQASGNVGTVQLAMQMQNGTPMSELGFLITLTHELVHNAITSKLANVDIGTLTQMNDLFAFVKKQAEGTEWEKHNALSNVHEFFAEGFSNPDFQKWMGGLDFSEQTKNLSPSRGSAFGRFLELLKKLLSLPDWVQTAAGQKVDVITALDQMASLGQQLEQIQREGGKLEVASPATPSTPNPGPPPLLDEPSLPGTKIAAGAAAVGRIAEKVVASREQAGAALENLSYERKQYRAMTAKLKELTDLATGRFVQQGIDPEEVQWPDPTAGVTVDQDTKQIVVGDEFVDALQHVGVPHDPNNVRDMQASIFFEQTSRRYNNVTAQIDEVERGIGYFKQLKVPKKDMAKAEKQLKALKQQQAKLADIDLGGELVVQRAAEMKAAQDQRTERQGKASALSLPPVMDFFGKEVGGWRLVQAKITDGISFLNAALSKSSTPEEVKAAKDKLAQWMNIPTDINDAINGGRALTDEQKASVYSALGQVFEEFDLRAMDMKDMADARLPELARSIRDQLFKIADAKIDKGMSEVLVADVLATLDGETGKSGTLTSQRRQLQLRKDVSAIKSFAMAVGKDLDVNADLFNWLINPTTMRPILPPGTTVGVGQTTFNMILDEVKSNPEFGSAILTLINASNEKLANIPVIGLKQIERLVKKGTAESLQEAKAIADQMMGQADSKSNVAAQALRNLLRSLTAMEVEQRSLQEGLAMFQELGADPDFVAVREHIADHPYGLVEPMVPSNHVQTTFKAFGNENIPSSPELVLGANQDPQFKAQWFQKVAEWMLKGQEHLDAYDAALAAYNNDTTGTIQSPTALGFDIPKVRGLRDAVGRYVPSAFLELSLLSENKRWRVPTIARKLSKSALFRQHDLVSKMVGGILGTDLRNRLADFVNHYQIAQSIRDAYKDLPDKLHAALKSHPEFNMNIQLYREHWNEMAHWGRMFGSPLRVDFILPRSGRIVSAADMALVQRERAYQNDLRRRVTETNPTQGVRVNTGTRTLVRPGAYVGDEGMPRYRNRRADNFINQIVAAYGEPVRTYGDPPSSLPLALNVDDEIVQFWNQRTDLLVQHILDARRTDRSMRLDPRMQQAEQELMNQWMMSGTTPTVTSLDDLVNQLQGHFNATPGLNAREELVRLLGDELKQYRDASKGILNERNLQDAARHSQPEIAFSADNEFTRPAAKLELPSSLYDYGALSPSEHLVLSSRANHERIVAYANAINRAVAEMRSRLNELGKTLTPDQVAQHYGGDLREMKEVMEILQKVQQDFKAAYDSGSFLRAPRGKINDTLGLLTSAVLASPVVGIRNMTAGQFEVYMMSRAMGNAGHWISLWRAMKNLLKTVTRFALHFGEGMVKNTNLGAAMLTGTNHHVFESAVQWLGEALTGSDYSASAKQVANLGMDSREGFFKRFQRILQETSEFSNLEDALSTWTVKGRRVGTTAAVPFQVIKALYDKIGVQQYDFAINSSALTYAEFLTRRMKEVALKYGQARSGLGPFNPNDPAWLMKGHEWAKFVTNNENDNALAFFRLFLEQSVGPEGFQLERSMWNWYQKQLQDPQTPLLTDRQMDALQRKLLADFNASTPANRPSAGPANPTVRNLLLLQGYVSDGVLKMLNSTLGSTRDKAGFAKSALKAPVIAMLALASIVLGLMQGSAVGAWEKWVRGRMTSLPTPMDKDFWTQISKFAEGTAGLAASNWMYLGDLILWINGEIHGNRGFDPYMRIFGLSVLQRAINAIRGVRETALGTQGLSTKSLIPLLDAVKSTAGWYYEVEHAMGGGAGKLKQGERVERGEYASQGMLQGRSGFTPPAYGPTTISRRLIGDYISQWNDLKEKDPAGAQRALDNAKEEIQKLEDYHYRKYLAAGKPEDEARKLAQRDTWNDYQEINPAVAALLGRRPTQAQHDLMLAGLSGDRLAAAQTAESYWKAGAMALFNREGYITKEEAAASRQGAGKGFALPGLPRLPQMPRMPNPFRRVRVPGVNRGPARNVRRAVQRMVSSPLNKVRRGRAAVRRFVNRQRTPSLAGRKRSVVRRQPFAPYSLA